MKNSGLHITNNGMERVYKFIKDWVYNLVIVIGQ